MIRPMKIVSQNILWLFVSILLCILLIFGISTSMNASSSTKIASSGFKLGLRQHITSKMSSILSMATHKHQQEHDALGLSNQTEHAADGETLADLLQQLLITADDEDEGRSTWQVRLQEIQESDELSPTEQIEAAMEMLVSASKGIEVGFPAIH